MSEAAPRAALLTVFVLTACTEQPEAPPPAPVVVAVVEPVKGNDVHNRLASGSDFDRNIGLAAIVKGVAGIPRCSIERYQFQGQSNGTATWSALCHTGTSYQIAIKPDGTGSVLTCGEALPLATTCWTDFAVANASDAPRRP